MCVVDAKGKVVREVKADTLLRMQTAYELAQAREHEADIRVEKFVKVA